MDFGKNSLETYAAPRSSRRSRTAFTPDQLGMLQAVFQSTACPDWEKIQELSSKLHLDECVIKTWFKNQRAKQRKLQRKGQPHQPSESTPQPPAPLPPPPGSEHSAPAQEDHGPGSSQAQGPEAAAEAPLPADLQDIHLDSSAPWASLPHDFGELVRMCSLFAGEEPDDLADI
ncbi:homeobox protein MIXL1-like [Lepus europaeus]|uniref:homeobox protein MIXL1-like n=1 Tax=Lepus europaeus TaxID=9983 RepID=UPI002B466896|nr:homeobox protein MIXL1-like [Lepus europaeus]XP_062031953.1 homeobox protein MIXL1-like [Lepus europaeus]